MYILKHITTCPNHENYPIKLEVNKAKVNRTNDGFTGVMELDRPLTENMPLKVVIYKQTDGGSKQFYVLNEASACHFIEEYGGKKNMEGLLENCGHTGASSICPISQGRHEMTNKFVFDFSQLPEDGMYGLYDAYAYIIDGGVEIGCILCTVEFKEIVKADK
ncbi:unnamed protein product [Diatraea saccharalis]|uniref:Uncharacterized protein n=1 Tax=Diatraea saccharalis TaxID=40085 RepID=A0A9N9N178_9NEOP|nr:unnamed protein product [Diatraea saccharalis]